MGAGIMHIPRERIDAFMSGLYELLMALFGRRYTKRVLNKQQQAIVEAEIDEAKAQAMENGEAKVGEEKKETEEKEEKEKKKNTCRKCGNKMGTGHKKICKGYPEPPVGNTVEVQTSQ